MHMDSFRKLLSYVTQRLRSISGLYQNWFFMPLLITVLISLGSCDKGNEDIYYPRSEDTYVITFTGDCEDFSGEISATTYSRNCILNTASFTEQNQKSFSDRDFTKTYELSLVAINNGQSKTVKIHCCALCISDKEKRMVCNIHKLTYGGDLIVKEYEFNSFPPGFHTTSENYSFNIDL